MLFNFATLALPLVLLGRVALATPLDTRAAEDTGLKVVDTKIQHSDETASPPRVESYKPRVASFAGETTSANTGFEALGGADDRDRFVVCDDLACSSNCRRFPLYGLSAGVCYNPGTFISTFIDQPSNTGLPYAFYVGTQNCANQARLLAVNTCYRSNIVRTTFIRN